MLVSFSNHFSGYSVSIMLQQLLCKDVFSSKVFENEKIKSLATNFLGERNHFLNKS